MPIIKVVHLQNTFIHLFLYTNNDDFWDKKTWFGNLNFTNFEYLAPRTTDAQWSLFSLKSRTFGLGQTNWADKFWGIWVIFGRTIGTHFGTVSPLAMFSIIQPLFLQKTKPSYLYIRIPNIYFGLGFEFGSQRIRNLAFVCL